MTIEIIFIILLGALLFVAMGAALHLARVNDRLRQYINELERDLKRAKTKRQNDYTRTT